MFWRDPEEFLDVVESAGSGATPAVDLLKMDSGSVSTETLIDMGRRALAIECSHFLRDARVETERWLPYRTWASLLDDRDTVLTFNYDRVPSILAEDGAHSKLSVVVPNDRADREIFDVREVECAPVLKLHGSVDWVFEDGQIKADSSPDLPVKCPKGSDLVLAIPGPDKMRLRRQYQGIGKLWSEGLRAIRYANQIVFVGYRFPPTDAQARMQILETIRKARTEKALERVQVVLGPDENDPDVARMKKLLGFVCPGIVEVLPLLAEDFLSLPLAYRRSPATQA